MTTEEKTKPVNELLEQALKNYEQAWKTGARMQEESARFFTSLATPAAGPQEWSKRVKVMTDEFIPQTQKSLDEGLKLLEHNSRTSVDLLKKAVSAAQATSPQEAQNRMLAVWEASLNTMRDTLTSVTQAHQKAVEGWIASARKGAETATATGSKA